MLCQLLSPISAQESRFCTHCQVLSITALTDRVSRSMNSLLGKEGIEKWDLELLSQLWVWHPLGHKTNRRIMNRLLSAKRPVTRRNTLPLRHSWGTHASNTPFCHPSEAWNKKISANGNNVPATGNLWSSHSIRTPQRNMETSHLNLGPNQNHTLAH